MMRIYPYVRGYGLSELESNKQLFAKPENSHCFTRLEIIERGPCLCVGMRVPMVGMLIMKKPT